MLFLLSEKKIAVTAFKRVPGILGVPEQTH
jgi:hypothetical protein